MRLTRYARALASRLTRTQPERPMFRPSALEWTPRASEVEDGTGTWLPACLVTLHDEVCVYGSWRAVTGTDTTKPSTDGPGSVVMYFGGERGLSCTYAEHVYARSTEHSESPIGGGR